MKIQSDMTMSRVTGPTPDTPQPAELGEAPPILPESPEQALLLGDVTAQIAALMIQSAKEHRKANEQLRRSADAMQRAEEQKEIQAMRDKAGHIMTAGLFEGAGMVATGSMQMGQGYSVSSMNSPEAARWNGGIALAGAPFKVGTAYFSAQQAADDATAKEASQAAGHAKTAVDNAQENSKAANDHIHKVLEFYKEMRTTEHNTHMAAVKR
jgi:hypothetical protein